MRIDNSSNIQPVYATPEDIKAAIAQELEELHKMLEEFAQNGSSTSEHKILPIREKIKELKANLAKLKSADTSAAFDKSINGFLVDIEKNIQNYNRSSGTKEDMEFFIKGIAFDYGHLEAAIQCFAHPEITKAEAETLRLAGMLDFYAPLLNHAEIYGNDFANACAGIEVTLRDLKNAKLTPGQAGKFEELTTSWDLISHGGFKDPDSKGKFVDLCLDFAASLKP